MGWGMTFLTSGLTTWFKCKLSELCSLSRVTMVLTSEFFSWYVCFIKAYDKLRLLSRLLECGLFEPKQGESQKWGQRESKYAVTIGMQLLAKIHCLESQFGNLGHQQNYLVNHLSEHINFIGDAGDHVGLVVDELNDCIYLQDIQIKQLATMVQ
jgi:hypothetical protein